MKSIKKFLIENNIEFTTEKSFSTDEIIVITLERDNIWVNGFGKEMKWDRRLTIGQDRYKKYVLKESTDYSRVSEHIRTGKQKEVCSKLSDLL